MPEDLTFMSALEMARLYRSRDLSPVEAVDHFLDRIDRLNPDLNAFVLVLHEEARIKARAAEAALASGAPTGPLHGIPIAIKDLFDFKAGVPNTFGSKPFAGFVPEVSSTYVERLEQAGAIVLGKTNTPEMGHKGITDNLLWGPTSTPFAPGKNAGGSSGGSAAALAAGLAPLAQGSDAGGSIRIPAAFCGVYGLKASYGRVASVSRPDGFFSHTPFIHAGPMARTVADTALMLESMAGEHPRDPFSLPGDGSGYLAAVDQSIAGKRIAYSPDFGVFPVDNQVRAIVADALPAFEAAGASVEEIPLRLPRSHQELAALWIRQMGVLYAEVAASFKAGGLDLLGDHRHHLCREFIQLLEGGADVGAVDYKLDDVIRTEVFDAIQDVFDTYDFLVTPTLAVPFVDNAGDGTTIGPTTIDGEDVEPCIGWCLTHPVNYTGHPAASIPGGFCAEGVPVGMQIIGRRFADASVLAASAAFEREHPWFSSYLDLERGRTS